VPGFLIAFEGLDQSGKATQARLLSERLQAGGHAVRLVSFPDYGTAIGGEIWRALHGERDYGADVIQLLNVANRYEWKTEIAHVVTGGGIVLCDRYLASSIAYGEAQGLEVGWLTEVQRFLPQPDLTILLDIAPAAAARRKTSDRDRFERDLELLERVRQSYHRQARDPGWIRIEGERPVSTVATEVAATVSRMLGLP
jgi:dTMP kinase